MDKALLTSLQSSHGVALSVVTESRFTEGGASYQLPTTASVTGESAQIAAAAERIQLAMTGPTYEQAEDLIVMLQSSTSNQRRSEDGSEAALNLYVHALTRYPADVAQAACEEVALIKRGTGYWFPALGELKEACDRLVARRAAMLNGLLAWKPPTTSQTLMSEARDWRYKAACMQDELDSFPKPSENRKAELKAAMAGALAKAKELTIEARAV